MWLQWGKLSRDTLTRKTRSQRHRTQTDGVFKPPSASALEPPEFCWETSPSGLPTFVDVMYLDTFQARHLATGLPVVPCPARLQIAFENMMKALTRPSKPAVPPAPPPHPPGRSQRKYRTADGMEVSTCGARDTKGRGAGVLVAGSPETNAGLCRA